MFVYLFLFIIFANGNPCNAMRGRAKGFTNLLNIPLSLKSGKFCRKGGMNI